MSDFTSTAQKIEENINQKIGQDKSAMDRVVAAGMKVMFSQQTHKYMTEILDKPGELGDKLALGIIDLMQLLFVQSKGAIPPQVIIPAATILFLRAGEFVEKTEGGMNDDVVIESLKLISAGVVRRLQKLSQGKDEGATQQDQQTQQAQPTQPAGLINKGV
jgi:hypothetical protein